MYFCVCPRLHQSIYTPYTYIYIKKNRSVTTLQIYILKKNLKYVHCKMYSIFTVFASIFGYDATSFAHLVILCHFSPQILFKLCQVGWGPLEDRHFQVSPKMFDWVQAQALTGPLKDIHRVVYKPLLHCLKLGIHLTTVKPIMNII